VQPTVQPIDELFARPGLDPTLRAIACAQIAAAHGDWSRLAHVLRTARAHGCDRDAVAEGLLQGVLFYGFPRTITAFEVLNDTWPTAAPPRGPGLPAAEQPAAGRALFSAIYGKNAPSVEAMLASFHAELHAFVLDVAYGRILSRPQLGARERELVAVAVLAAMQQTPQMVAHGRGALHFGADVAALREVLHTALAPEGAAVERALARITRTAATGEPGSPPSPARD